MAKKKSSPNKNTNGRVYPTVDRLNKRDDNFDRPDLIIGKGGTRLRYSTKMSEDARKRAGYK